MRLVLLPLALALLGGCELLVPREVTCHDVPEDACAAVSQQVRRHFVEGGNDVVSIVLTPTEYSQCADGSAPLYDATVRLSGRSDPVVVTVDYVSGVCFSPQ